MKATKKKKLPPLAREFLSAHSAKKFKWVLRAFHRWMTDWKIGFKDLGPAHIESFLRRPRGKDISPDSHRHYRRHLAKYLIWLHGKDLLRFDPAYLFGRQKLKLPNPAAQFVRSSEPTRKESTLNGYRKALRYFHRWLEEHKAPIEKLRRPHMSAWFVY